MPEDNFIPQIQPDKKEDVQPEKPQVEERCILDPIRPINPTQNKEKQSSAKAMF